MHRDDILTITANEAFEPVIVPDDQPVRVSLQGKQSHLTSTYIGHEVSKLACDDSQKYSTSDGHIIVKHESQACSVCLRSEDAQNLIGSYMERDVSCYEPVFMFENELLQDVTNFYEQMVVPWDRLPLTAFGVYHMFQSDTAALEPTQKLCPASDISDDDFEVWLKTAVWYVEVCMRSLHIAEMHRVLRRGSLRQLGMIGALKTHGDPSVDTGTETNEVLIHGRNRKWMHKAKLLRERLIEQANPYD